MDDQRISELGGQGSLWALGSLWAFNRTEEIRSDDVTISTQGEVNASVGPLVRLKDGHDLR